MEYLGGGSALDLVSWRPDGPGDLVGWGRARLKKLSGGCP